MMKSIPQVNQASPPPQATPQQTPPELAVRLKAIADDLEAAYRADHTPPFSRWHLLGLTLVVLFLLAQQYAPGLIADLGRIVLAEASVAVLARVTTIILAMVALFVVRSMHPLTAFGLWLSVLGVGFRLGEVRVMQEPLSLAFALVLLGICTVAVRVIIRPNETDQIHMLKARLAALERYAEAHQHACTQVCTGEKHDS